jgi:hypothetical protein
VLLFEIGYEWEHPFHSPKRMIRVSASIIDEIIVQIGNNNKGFGPALSQLN